MSEKTFTITNDEADIRLDKLLTIINESVSRQQIQKAIKAGNVTVNGEVKKANYVCKVDDIIHFILEYEKESKEIEPEPIPLAIEYEDDHLLVVNKPKGMIVHPTETIRTNTLVNGLLHYCKHLSTISGNERPGIVHRLDKDTSGLIVVAKDDVTHRHLKEQFQRRTVYRLYEAVVHGSLSHTDGIIRAPIGRNPKNRLKMAVVKDGKEAETHFKTVTHYDAFTLVQCELKTGRTHQIRVHLDYIGHPIVGDPLYGNRRNPYVDSQALYAKTIRFVHPQTKEMMTFTIDRPEEFKNLLQKISVSS